MAERRLSPGAEFAAMPGPVQCYDNLVAPDNVLPQLLAWRRKGLRTVLVTLVGIEGTTPRPLGAQMAVAEDGRYAGYLSGGCLERAVALEAIATINVRANSLVRYGRGSRYFDLRLPCGSGLDLYFDQGLHDGVLAEAARLGHARRPFELETDLSTGVSRVSALADPRVPTKAAKTFFTRSYFPAPRVALLGSGPAFMAIAHLLRATGFELEALSSDEATLRLLHANGIPARMLPDANGLADHLDRWTAVVLSSHDHDREAPLLMQALKSECYYIGAMGSRRTHATRTARLLELGASPEACVRVRGPIGLIAGAKGVASLAVGVLAEIVEAAKLNHQLA